MEFVIRLASLDDAKCCADIHAQSWSFAYSDIVPKEIIIEHNARWIVIWNKMLANNMVTLNQVVLQTLKKLDIYVNSEIKENHSVFIQFFFVQESQKIKHLKELSQMRNNRI